MINGTVTLEKGKEWEILPIYICWVVQFLLIGIPNLIICATVARYEALRNQKEYLVISGLMCADGLYIACFIFAGEYQATMLGSRSKLSKSLEQYIIERLKLS